MELKSFYLNKLKLFFKTMESIIIIIIIIIIIFNTYEIFPL